MGIMHEPLLHGDLLLTNVHMYFFLTQKLSQNCNRGIGIYFHFCTRRTDLHVGLLKIKSYTCTSPIIPKDCSIVQM